MRTKLEMSQRDLCRALSEEYGREISPVTISTWETGRRPVPEKYITSLCAVFNCTYDYLAGLSNNEDEVFTEQSEKTILIILKLITWNLKTFIRALFMSNLITECAKADGHLLTTNTTALYLLMVLSLINYQIVFLGMFTCLKKDLLTKPT